MESDWIINYMPKIITYDVLLFIKILKYLISLYIYFMIEDTINAQLSTATWYLSAEIFEINYITNASKLNVKIKNRE